MSIIERINELRLERGWSVNNLALEAGITQSTLNSVLQRGTAPKIDTLQCICNAFGISLSQFFLEEEETELLNDKEKELVSAFRKLTEDKQYALLDLLS